MSWILKNTTALVAALPQSVTNGGSKLGTLNAPAYSLSLTNNCFNASMSTLSDFPLPTIYSGGPLTDLNQPMPNGWPWGTKTPWNSDPYTEAPNTGVVRNYDFTIARGVVAPDGYTKDMLLINGQYPGPPIEANWGDTIQVTVRNAITDPEEGTTIHYHGLMQQNSEWEDGVPGISMCPIPPGGSFTQTFKATPAGSTFYHSHYSSQYADGLWGPVIIHGPSNLAYDIDLGPVTLNDYYHTPYFTVLEGVVGPVIPSEIQLIRPASDNNLINGKMNFNCANNTLNGTCVDNAGLAKFQFTSGMKHRLRLINTGIAAIQKFSIDNHTMEVIANDFIPIEPYNTTIVTLGVGQRTDVVVEATGQLTDIVWMRSTIASGECTEPANQPLALAVIYYQHANTTATPRNDSVAQVDNTAPCQNDALTEPVPEYAIAAGTPATTINMAVNFTVNATGHLVWTINESTFRADYNQPLLLLANAGNTSYPYDPQWNVYDIGSNASVRVVITNQTPTSHPWHLHGHEMSVLASGTGTWDGTVVNANNPQRRDVQILPANGYIVLQWQSNNPGVWPFHCHIAWHVSGGLYSNILEQPAGIKSYSIPSTSFQNCQAWGNFTNSDTIWQIDSGL